MHAVAAAAALLLVATPLAAQTVAGRLSDRTEAPVAEAIVSLVDSAGQEVTRAATSSSGRFRLSARAPGAYRVRAFRIGHGAWTSEPIALAAGQVHTLDAVLPDLAVELPELIAVAPGACQAADTGSAAAILLEEARKALALAREANRRGLSFAVTTFDMVLDPDLRVLEEHESRSPSYRDLPIVSTTVDTLRRFGFVRPVPAYDPNGPVYYGPDERVLLSDWFLTSHCFTVSATDDSIVAVDFAPAERRGLADIAGTMRFDTDSLVLRSLRFTYVRLPRWVPEGVAGGAVEFERMAGVGLVATQWWLRAPIAEVPMGRGDTRLHGYREAGGAVLGVGIDGGAQPPSAAPDSLLGRVPVPAETAGPAEGEPPLLLKQEMPGMAGRRLLARNTGARAVTITTLEVRECANVAAGCGRHRLDRRVAPGETVHLLIVRPRDAARAYSFALSYQWEPAE